MEDNSPLFLSFDMEQENIITLINEALAENKNLFLVDLKIDANNKINVILDGDSGITLKECIRINRFIENNLDRETEDYSLEVSSPDISQPLTIKRQYNKNIGKIIKVKTETNKFEGKLTNINQDTITLTWKTREPKPIGKGKITVEKTATIPFKEITETKVKILF